MKLTTQSVYEHKSSSSPDVLSPWSFKGGMVVPGASTCCTGCTSTSTAAIVERPELKR